ncbi:uncharacterized membrane protein YhaH (DUF805 family) [Nitrospirillum amazonense]|uniref:Uncharacterized membrane protein YhaH (DUF805 family) n=1 Tax=Nitrospirillum amazonense TaxID=28077 RepID=A0A560FA74_9PROT|nr:DUF805 domain-containing protein [Nitrospirillum amazonense]TWB18522.1 uncharacterized membrane protein YhaH (DUF805 family) [Nitrospirillum amazonense]
MAGRISRREYWLKFQLPLMAVYWAMAGLGFVTAGIPPTIDNGSGEGLNIIYFALVVLVAMASGWASLAVNVKRCHDRDRSGWFILIQLVPGVGALWFLVETGFLPGSIGANRFGADPQA